MNEWEAVNNFLTSLGLDGDGATEEFNGKKYVCREYWDPRSRSKAVAFIASNDKQTVDWFTSGMIWHREKARRTGGTP